MTIAGAVAAQYLPPKAIERAQFTFSRQRVLVQGAILGLTLLVVTTLGPQGVAPFIYYRF